MQRPPRASPDSGLPKEHSGPGLADGAPGAWLERIRAVSRFLAQDGNSRFHREAVYYSSSTADDILESVGMSGYDSRGATHQSEASVTQYPQIPQRRESELPEADN